MPFEWNKVLRIAELEKVTQPSQLKKHLLTIATQKNRTLAEIVNLPDENNITLLMYSAALDSALLITILLELQADINYQGAFRCTALHVACELGCGNAVSALLLSTQAKKINIDLPDDQEKKAQEIALQLSEKVTFDVVTTEIVVKLDEVNNNHRICSQLHREPVASKPYIASLFWQHANVLKVVEEKEGRNLKKRCLG
jgi:hypothetical protein